MGARAWEHQQEKFKKRGQRGDSGLLFRNDSLHLVAERSKELLQTAIDSGIDSLAELRPGGMNHKVVIRCQTETVSLISVNCV